MTWAFEPAGDDFLRGHGTKGDVLSGEARLITGAEHPVFRLAAVVSSMIKKVFPSHVASVNGSRVEFSYAGRHQELLKQIRTQDVCWTSRLLSRLTEKQKRDAFRAAAYPDDVARRFIVRLDSKISDGLKLCASQ